MSVKCLPPHTPFSYSKTGVCRGILGIPSQGGSNEHPQSMFWSKNKKNIKYSQLKIFNFYNLGKISILHGHVFVMCLCLNFLEIC